MQIDGVPIHACLLCIYRYSTIPLDKVGDGGDDGGGDEVAVGDEHVGAHAGLQRQLRHHIHAGEPQLHEHHGHGRHAVLAHAALLCSDLLLPAMIMITSARPETRLLLSLSPDDS